MDHVAGRAINKKQALMSPDREILPLMIEQRLASH